MTIGNTTRARLRKQKKGFTLTEIAIVLGIMGLILGAIWVAAAGVYNNQRINQGSTGILQVLQGVRNLYAQQASMAAQDQTAAVIAAGIVPTNLINGAGTGMQTPWGTAMYVGGTKDLQGVAITVQGMSSALCTGIMSAVAGASHDRTLSTTTLIANANQGANAAGNTNSGTLYTGGVVPVVGAAATLAAAITAGTNGCTANSSTNSVTFIFGLAG